MAFADPDLYFDYLPGFCAFNTQQGSLLGYSIHTGYGCFFFRYTYESAKNY